MYIFVILFAYPIGHIAPVKYSMKHHFTPARASPAVPAATLLRNQTGLRPSTDLGGGGVCPSPEFSALPACAQSMTTRGWVWDLWAKASGWSHTPVAASLDALQLRCRKLQLILICWRSFK